MEHTLGPWVLSTSESAVVVEAGERRGWTVADLSRTYTELPNKERKANARLIAAAPTMYEALEAVDEWYDLVAQDYPEMLAAFRKVRAVLNLIKPTVVVS